MEFIIEKIGMSRTIGVPSVPVTLLKVIETKVCELREDGKALVAKVTCIGGDTDNPKVVIQEEPKASLEDILAKKTLLPECPFSPPPRPPEERKRREGARGQAGELPFP